MTSEQPSSEERRSRTELLDLVDHELRRIADDARVNGLTSWGLAVTLGVLLTSAGEAWAKATPTEIQPREVGLWFVLLSFAWDQISSRFRSQPTGTRFGIGIVRFLPLGFIVSGWAQFVVILSRLALIVGVALLYRGGVPWWGLVGVLGHYVLLASASISMAVTGLRDFLLPINTAGTLIGRIQRKIKWPGRVFDAGLMVAGLAGYGFAVSLPKLGTPVGSLRLAALLAAAAVIIELLAVRAWRPPLIGELEELRRNIVFGLVRLEEAFAELQALLYGLRGDAVLQKELTAAFQRFDVTRSAENTAKLISDHIETDLREATAGSSALEQAEMRYVKLIQQRELAIAAIDDLDELLPRLQRHFLNVLTIDPTTAHTTESIRGFEINELRTESRNRRTRIEGMVEAAKRNIDAKKNKKPLAASAAFAE